MMTVDHPNVDQYDWPAEMDAANCSKKILSSESWIAGRGGDQYRRQRGRQKG